MKESATLALEYIKSHANEIGIDEKMFEENDIHVHVPAGAVPKDGPSAGITMVTALVSSLTGRNYTTGQSIAGRWYPGENSGSQKSRYQGNYPLY